MLKTELTMFLTGTGNSTLTRATASRLHQGSSKVVSKRKFILQNEKSKAKRYSN